MRIKPALVAAVMLVLPLDGRTLTIDDFATSQAQLEVSRMGPNAAASSVSGAGILGGERDLRIFTDPGASTLGARVDVSGGQAHWSNDTEIVSTLHFQWDGFDNDSSLNAGGLGSVDLTDGNASDAFEINFAFDDLPASITLTVHSGAGNSSSATFPTTGGLFGTIDFSLFMPFVAFTTAAGAGADFMAVSAIEMTMTSEVQPLIPAPDVTINYIQTTLQPVPAPPAALLLVSGLLGLGLSGRRKQTRQ